jgi:hypothetical protein
MEEIEEDLSFFSIFTHMHIYAYIKLVYILKIIEELFLIYLNYLLMFRDG